MKRFARIPMSLLVCVAAMIPLGGCLADEPEDTDEVADVEDELELGVVEDAGAGEGADEGETGTPLGDVDGVADAFDDPAEEVAVAFGESGPGGDRMAEPIPYPSDDPKGSNADGMTIPIPEDPNDPTSDN
jgi:hypothetical protein